MDSQLRLGTFADRVTWFLESQGRWSGPQLAEQCPRLDMAIVRTLGPGVSTLFWSDGSKSRVVPMHTGLDVVHNPANADFWIPRAVSFSFTSCNFGGERTWFLCPRCDRRRAVLYAYPGFLCRTCNGLTYSSTHRRPPWRPEPVCLVQTI